MLVEAAFPLLKFNEETVRTPKEVTLDSFQNDYFGLDAQFRPTETRKVVPNNKEDASVTIEDNKEISFGKSFSVNDGIVATATGDGGSFTRPRWEVIEVKNGVATLSLLKDQQLWQWAKYDGKSGFVQIHRLKPLTCKMKCTKWETQSKVSFKALENNFPEVCSKLFLPTGAIDYRDNSVLKGCV